MISLSDIVPFRRKPGQQDSLPHLYGVSWDAGDGYEERHLESKDATTALVIDLRNKYGEGLRIQFFNPEANDAAASNKSKIAGT